MLRNQKGFTLMELMIVIVIIGVLAAIGIPSYNGYVRRAKIGACDANKRNIQTAAGLYWADKSLTLTGHNTATDTGDTLGEYLSNVKDIKCPYDTGTQGYDVTIDSSGKVTVECKAAHPTK